MYETLHELQQEARREQRHTDVKVWKRKQLC
jgi:hypothetical protein